MAKYISTKTYGTDRGLSCCFRQWKADHSHCSTLHGYSIGIKLIFQSNTLDEKNWVMDFGGLKAFKAWADHMFDHTMLIAKDDPYLETFKSLNRIGGGYKDSGVVDLRIVEAVGCEAFAEMTYHVMNNILTEFQNNDIVVIDDQEFTARYPVSKDVKLVSVEVFEHAGNSAIYEGDLD
jgi:6-pyruvoyltetrahydropterin/6-carboxytetrahydropterin synthase